MRVKLLKILEVYKILPKGGVSYDFLLWEGCEVRLGETLPGRKRIHAAGPIRKTKKTGRKKVTAITIEHDAFRNKNFYVLSGDLEGNAYVKISD